MNPKIETAINESIDDYLADLDGEAQAENMYYLVISEAERVLIKKGLQHNDYNQTQTAKWLGVTRNTLKKKMMAYRL